MKTRIILFSIILAFASCKSKYQKLLKSSDYNAKYEAALGYYAEEDYYKAQNLFESIITVYRGTDKAENINYHLAYCYYNQGEFILSGYYFENYTTTFPSEEKTSECQYMTGISFEQESPKPSLDQEYTLGAIEAFQMYLNRYPEGEHYKESNDKISLLRAKLEQKDFENAKLYHKLGDYKAAVIALKNVLIEYPDTDKHEEVLFLVLDSSYELADNSVATKKYQRYESAVDEYYSYIDQYPGGKYAKDAEKVYDDCMTYLKKKK